MPTSSSASGFASLVAALTLGWFAAGPAAAAAPSFDCARAADRSIQTLICRDDALAALDRRLDRIYQQARQKAADEQPPTLAAEQRGWIKGRDDCWKAADPTACVTEAYRLRSAELQARYRLVAGVGPVRYACDGQPANELVATFYPTDPPVAIAERGDQVSVMFRQPAASGERYAGRNETLWAQDDEARVQWGYGAPEMRCLRKPR